jgi:hypothetical protein
MSHIESLTDTWWKPYHMFNEGPRPKLTKRVQNKSIMDALLNAADMLGVDEALVTSLMKLYLPKKASDNESISYFPSYYKYNLGMIKHRTKVSPGRFFLKVFPSAPNQLVEAFAAHYQSKVVFDPTNYVLSVGNTKDDFRNAFTKYVKTRGDFNYNDNSASISDSCMRYPFNRLSDHPSVVYASGDFVVATVKNKAGKTRARAVLAVRENKKGVKEYIRQRIYGSCNHSKQMLLDYFRTIPMVNQSWSGFKLLRVEAYEGVWKDFLCPFIDDHRYVSVYNGKYLVIASSSYEDCNSTGGVVSFTEPDNDHRWLKNAY